MVQENDQEGDLRRQLIEMQKELATINMVDQFAKYAKLERKINRLKEELSKISKNLDFLWNGFDLLIEILCVLAHIVAVVV